MYVWICQSDSHICSSTKVLFPSTSNQRWFLRSMQIKLFLSEYTISVCDILWEILLCFSDKRQCKGSMCFPFLLYKAIVCFHLAKHDAQSIKKSCCEYHVKLGKGFMCSNNAVLLKGDIKI